MGDLRSSRKTNCDQDPVLCRFQQDFDIETIISHPNYDKPKYANDIALIKYKNTNPAQRNIPICLPLQNTANYNQNLGILAGWNKMVDGKSLKIYIFRKINKRKTSRKVNVKVKFEIYPTANGK